MRYLRCCDHSNRCLFLVFQQVEVLPNFLWWVYFPPSMGLRLLPLTLDGTLMADQESLHHQFFALTIQIRQELYFVVNQFWQPINSNFWAHNGCTVCRNLFFSEITLNFACDERKITFISSCDGKYSVRWARPLCSYYRTVHHLYLKRKKKLVRVYLGTQSQDLWFVTKKLKPRQNFADDIVWNFCLGLNLLKAGKRTQSRLPFFL